MLTFVVSDNLAQYHEYLLTANLHPAAARCLKDFPDLEDVDLTGHRLVCISEHPIGQRVYEELRELAA